MKFFTPELYLKFNVDPSEETHEEWESAISNYRLHLNRIDLTREAAEFITEYMHDAKWEGMKLVNFDNQLCAIVSVLKENKNRVILFYVLVEEPAIINVPDWPYSKTCSCWMYDEFDILGESQTHEIFLSDGRLVLFKFQEMRKVLIS